MHSRRALLVVDLEGVAGVDSPGALISGTPEYVHARALLTAEVNAAVEGLLAAGFHRVRVSDSHLSGSGESNLLPESLHPAAEPCFLPEDAYAPALFEEVDGFLRDAGFRLMYLEKFPSSGGEHGEALYRRISSLPRPGVEVDPVNELLENR